MRRNRQLKAFLPSDIAEALLYYQMESTIISPGRRRQALYFTKYINAYCEIQKTWKITELPDYGVDPATLSANLNRVEVMLVSFVTLRNNGRL